MTPIATNGLHPNLEAFLKLITKTEGTDLGGKPYNIIFGGSYFSDFARHPNKRIGFFNPKTKKNDYSTAAGRYQINYPTYKELGMSSFTPKAQDEAAIELIKRSNAYNDVINGNFETALKKTSKRWASLPFSTSGQPKSSLQSALDFLKLNGGKIAAVNLGFIFVVIIILFLNSK